MWWISKDGAPLNFAGTGRLTSMVLLSEAGHPAMVLLSEAGHPAMVLLSEAGHPVKR
jgi:hypothetical protein